MKPVKTSRKEELTAPLWSDFFADRLFSSRWPFNGQELFPAVNVSEDDEAFQAEFEVPGFGREDFKIDVEDNCLTVSAEKEAEKNESNQRFTKKEFERTSFSRTFSLPQNVDDEKIEAFYNHGILRLTIPKKEKRKPDSKKEIKVS